MASRKPCVRARSSLLFECVIRTPMRRRRCVRSAVAANGPKVISVPRSTMNDRRLIRSSRWLPTCRCPVRRLMLSRLDTRWACEVPQNETAMAPPAGSWGFRLHHCSYLYDGSMTVARLAVFVPRYFYGRRRFSPLRGGRAPCQRHQFVARIWRCLLLTQRSHSGPKQIVRLEGCEAELSESVS